MIEQEQHGQATKRNPALSTRQILNVANQLTASRLAMSIVLFILISIEAWWWCLLIFALAAFTDWLDGYLARKYQLTSALGRVFDPLVDKVLVCGAYIFLLALPYDRTGVAPWMATVVVARELVINGLRSFLESQGVHFGADWLGKIKMGLQCGALGAVFLALALETLPTMNLFRDILVYAMLAVTALSGLQYLVKAFIIMREHSKEVS